MDTPQSTHTAAICGHIIKARDIADHYVIGAQIARGAFSRVFACKSVSRADAQDDQKSPMVVKMFGSKHQFMRTLSAHAAIRRYAEGIADGMAARDSHIEQICDNNLLWVSGHIQPFVVMPRYEIQLSHYVEQYDKEHDTGIPAVAVKAIARKMFMALDILQHAGVVHGDIKPSNFMLRTTPSFDIHNVHNLDLVLCDFGSARITTEERGYMCEPAIIGTTSYVAPEVLLWKDYSFGADIWSAMASIFFVITTTHLFDVCDDDHLDYGIDFTGIAARDEDSRSSAESHTHDQKRSPRSSNRASSSVRTSSSNRTSLSDDDDSYDRPDLEFPMIYANLILMYRLIGRPPEVFCALAPEYYQNGVPRYHPTIEPGTIARFLDTNFVNLARHHTRQIDEFLQLGLRYMDSDRSSASNILAHPFLG